MKIATFLLCVLVLPATITFGQVSQKDITSDVKAHMEKHFVGASVSDGPTVIHRHEPKGPGGIKLPGWEDRAKGSASIEKLQKIDGKIQRISVPDLDLDFVSADIKMVFSYTSQTSCERISRPGGVVVDKPWGSLSPKGTITLHLRIEKQKNGKLTQGAFVEAGHGDRPNAYIRDHLASRLAVRANQLLQDFLGVQIDQN